MSMEAIYDVLTSIEKLGKVTDMPIEKDTRGGMELDHTQLIGIEVQHLDVFGALEQNKINEDISFKVPPGSNTCLTGDAGSGKFYRNENSKYYDR